jgi:hypothetical protein
MPVLTDPITDFLRQVAIVEKTGVAMPAEWVELRSRFDSFAALNTPMLTRLTDAVVSGDTGADVEALRAMAAAEQVFPEQLARVTNHVRRQTFEQLRSIYSGVARDNYAAIAAQFDQQAEAFMTAAKTADVEADAADMLKTGSGKQHRAWLDAESYARRLSELVEPLVAAAELAAVKILDTERDTILLPLTVDTAGQHRRKVWTAWLRTDGRCTRWSALVEAGCIIRAANLDEIEAYAELRPIEHRQRQIPGQPRGTYETVTVDPEDEGYEPEQPELGMLPGRMLTR